jgi:hypothetical protein
VNKALQPRSLVLLGVVILLLLAGWILPRFESQDAAPPLDRTDLTPAVVASVTSQPSPSLSVTKSPGASETPRPAANRDLSTDEAKGGHTLARHVAQTDEQLAARLKAESDISAASSYTDRPAAEFAVGKVLADKTKDIQKWADKSGNRANLALREDVGKVVGRSLKRGAKSPVDVTDVVVVLAWRNDGWFVLTSYPEDR